MSHDLRLIRPQFFFNLVFVFNLPIALFLLQTWTYLFWALVQTS